MTLRSRTSSALRLVGLATTSVSAGPMTMSMPTSIRKTGATSVMAAKGDGYQHRNTSKAASAAMNKHAPR